jgi:hypothetical protein
MKMVGGRERIKIVTEAKTVFGSFGWPSFSLRFIDAFGHCYETQHLGFIQNIIYMVIFTTCWVVFHFP